MKQISNDDMLQAFQLLGIEGSHTEIVKVEIERDRVNVVRQHLQDGKAHLDNDRLVLTSEDIRIRP